MIEKSHILSIEDSIPFTFRLGYLLFGFLQSRYSKVHIRFYCISPTTIRVMNLTDLRSGLFSVKYDTKLSFMKTFRPYNMLDDNFGLNH